MSLEKQFLQHLLTLVPNAKGQRFLLAVSGGKDSTALVHLFASAGMAFEIAHCNFHLRGHESDEDELFVRKLAEKFHKKPYIKHFHTEKEQKGSGKSIEMVAREERYAWFDEIGKDFDFIITAHHADDNAETLLLNLCRGTGLKGMTGIPALSGKYLRPLLPFSSEEILQYLKGNLLPFRTDSSNFSLQYHRNKIRHSIIPTLREINPEIIATFCQNIAHFNQQYNFYISEIQKIISEISFSKDNNLYISIEKLKLHESADLILFEILHPFGFTPAIINNVLETTSNISGKTFFSATHKLLKDREFLIIKEIGNEIASEQVIHNAEELQKAGFDCELLSADVKPTFGESNNVLYVDANHWHFPITLRRWNSGDYFYPFGMKGKQKVSDFFNNSKISRFEKQEIPILCIDNQIVWIVGYRTDGRFAITKQTKQYYKVTWFGNPKQ